MPGESKADFLARLSQASREKRDLAVAKLRKKYSKKFDTLQERLRRAEQAIMREKEQASSRKMQTMIDGAHAHHEHIDVGRSLERCALLAMLLLAEDDDPVAGASDAHP